MNTLTSGLAAGAVGTAVLDAVTWTDVAVSGREPSDAPLRTLEAVADQVGVSLPTGGARDQALGTLAGAGVGAGIGLAAAGLRRVGVRLPLLAEAAIVGAGAMLATDGPMHATGVSDVTTWSAQDWVRDAVPHLAYGLAVSSTLRALDPAPTRGGRGRPGGGTSVTVPDDADAAAARRTGSRTGRLVKSLALGVATGARSSMGLVPPAASAGTVPALLAGGFVLTELVIDKRPSTPSRLQAMPAGIRVVLGAWGAAAAARHAGHGALVPAAAGAVGAALGTLGGWALREACAERGWGTAAAVVEDGVALGLTAWATPR